ncbi:hypothetical protein OC846_000420 [Tilletia horrida]|uniref:BZIP domain-containing protein n=1 Tax=Tilletia horrida TaxID=155126 RepID=A0AAN6JUH4_9BASI|nr:hypothetical protein OC845_001062 [Tilletia horrida]KAK0557432.1 hypothetical protein OC846_000420 [Tilletia horrida]KAK0569536.1 hypothetical protein OC861_000805 [Tilletia horrida]
MQFSKSALLAFTTLAISVTVQGAALSGPQERSIIGNSGFNALDLRSLELAEQKLALAERDPRKSAKKSSGASVARVNSGAGSIKAATSELRKFRAAHKASKKNKSRDLEERAKAQNVADLRKALRKVNKHLLTAASQLRQVNKRDEGAMEKRLVNLPPVPIVTDIIPTVTDIIPTVTDILPTDVLPTDILPTDVLPTDILPTDILPTDILPTDILPTSILPTDILPTTLPTLTLPTLTLPTPTNTVPVGGIAAIIAAIRALIALIREFIQELVATILDIFTGGSPDISVLSEVAPGVSAVFGATKSLARDVSPSVGSSVSSSLDRVQAVLARYGVKA